MTDKTIVSNSNSLLLWDKDWFKAQRLYIISKIAKRIQREKNWNEYVIENKKLLDFIQNNDEDIKKLCKLFNV